MLKLPQTTQLQLEPKSRTPAKAGMKKEIKTIKQEKPMVWRSAGWRRGKVSLQLRTGVHGRTAVDWQPCVSLIPDFTDAFMHFNDNASLFPQPPLLSLLKKICSTCCNWHSGMVDFTLVLEDSFVPWKAFENFSLCHSRGKECHLKRNICFHNCALWNFFVMLPFFDKKLFLLLQNKGPVILAFSHQGNYSHLKACTNKLASVKNSFKPNIISVLWLILIWEFALLTNSTAAWAELWMGFYIKYLI